MGWLEILKDTFTVSCLIISIQKWYRVYHMYLDRQAWAKGIDPDEMSQKAASYQGLYYLPLIQQFLDITSGSKLFKF